MLYRIVVPSTKNESIPVDSFTHAERVKKVFSFLSVLNGGATAINSCFGGWVNGQNEVVGENVVIVESFGDDEKLEQIKSFCESVRVEWSQDCIGLQVLPCDMYFI